MAHSSKLATLPPETLDAYHAYISNVQAQPEQQFLWSDRSHDWASQVKSGKTVVRRLEDGSEPKVQHALIHDWLGATHAQGATLARTLAMLQNYDNHKQVYHPEVGDSKLLDRNGDQFQIYLRLVKKKIITVVLDTWHSVEYGFVDATRAYCRSHTTRICEVEHAGSAGEFTYLPDTGHGFLWRMYSHWKLEERGNGVTIECRVVSLTRDIPAAVNWVVSPMLHKLPAESLKSTLEATRRALIS